MSERRSGRLPSGRRRPRARPARLLPTSGWSFPAIVAWAAAAAAPAIGPGPSFCGSRWRRWVAVAVGLSAARAPGVLAARRRRLPGGAPARFAAPCRAGWRRAPQAAPRELGSRRLPLSCSAGRRRWLAQRCGPTAERWTASRPGGRAAPPCAWSSSLRGTRFCNVVWPHGARTLSSSGPAPFRSPGGGRAGWCASRCWSLPRTMTGSGLLPGSQVVTNGRLQPARDGTTWQPCCPHPADQCRRGLRRDCSAPPAPSVPSCATRPAGLSDRERGCFPVSWTATSAGLTPT